MLVSVIDHKREYGVNDTVGKIKNIKNMLLYVGAIVNRRNMANIEKTRNTKRFFGSN